VTLGAFEIVGIAEVGVGVLTMVMPAMSMPPMFDTIVDGPVHALRVE
jgi:hypothetical protein